MKITLCFCLTLVHCLNAYRIVTLPKPEEEVRLKVHFSTKVVSQICTVTSTVTQTAFATCYAAEPGIVDCENRRDTEESEPKVELDGEPTSWESIISPSKTARVARQVEVEEIVEIVEASENVQVIQPDLGEPAAVVYPTIVHQSREDEFILDEQKLEEVPEMELFEDEVEARTDKAEVRHHEQEIEDDDEEKIESFEDEVEARTEKAEPRHHEHEIEDDDEEDEHVSDDSSDLELEDENQDEVVEPEVVSDETTTFEPEFYEITTIMDNYEEANPSRENPDGPILELESSWEVKEVVIRQDVNTKCMEMKNNNLFMNVMSTLISTMTEYEYTTVSGLNSVLFKSEGGCLPSNVNEMFTSSCV